MLVLVCLHVVYILFCLIQLDDGFEDDDWADFGGFEVRLLVVLFLFVSYFAFQNKSKKRN